MSRTSAVFAVLAIVLSLHLVAGQNISTVIDTKGYLRYSSIDTGIFLVDLNDTVVTFFHCVPQDFTNSEYSNLYITDATYQYPFVTSCPLNYDLLINVNTFPLLGKKRQEVSIDLEFQGVYQVNVREVQLAELTYTSLTQTVYADANAPSIAAVNRNLPGGFKAITNNQENLLAMLDPVALQRAYYYQWIPANDSATFSVDTAVFLAGPGDTADASYLSDFDCNVYVLPNLPPKANNYDSPFVFQDENGQIIRPGFVPEEQEGPSEILTFASRSYLQLSIPQEITTTTPTTEEPTVTTTGGPSITLPPMVITVTQTVTASTTQTISSTVETTVTTTEDLPPTATETVTQTETSTTTAQPTTVTATQTDTSTQTVTTTTVVSSPTVVMGSQSTMVSTTTSYVSGSPSVTTATQTQTSTVAGTTVTMTTTPTSTVTSTSTQSFTSVTTQTATTTTTEVVPTTTTETSTVTSTTTVTAAPTTSTLTLSAGKRAEEPEPTPTSIVDDFGFFATPVKRQLVSVQRDGPSIATLVVADACTELDIATAENGASYNLLGDATKVSCVKVTFGDVYQYPLSLYFSSEDDSVYLPATKRSNLDLTTPQGETTYVWSFYGTFNMSIKTYPTLNVTVPADDGSALPLTTDIDDFQLIKFVATEPVLIDFTESQVTTFPYGVFQSVSNGYVVMDPAMGPIIGEIDSTSQPENLVWSYSNNYTLDATVGPSVYELTQLELNYPFLLTVNVPQTAQCVDLTFNYDFKKRQLLQESNIANQPTGNLLVPSNYQEGVYTLCGLTSGQLRAAVPESATEMNVTFSNIVRLSNLNDYTLANDSGYTMLVIPGGFYAGLTVYAPEDTIDWAFALPDNMANAQIMTEKNQFFGPYGGIPLFSQPQHYQGGLVRAQNNGQKMKFREVNYDKISCTVDGDCRNNGTCANGYCVTPVAPPTPDQPEEPVANNTGNPQAQLGGSVSLVGRVFGAAVFALLISMALL